MPTKKAIAKAWSGARLAKRPSVSKGIPGFWITSIASLTRWLAARKARAASSASELIGWSGAGEPSNAF
jgi:hypothetical protein